MKSVYWNKIPVRETADGLTGSAIQCVPGNVSQKRFSGGLSLIFVFKNPYLNVVIAAIVKNGRQLYFI